MAEEFDNELDTVAKNRFQKALAPDEEIEEWVEGDFWETMALTPRRVIVVKPKKVVGGTTFSSFPLETIISVELHEQRLHSVLEIRQFGDTNTSPNGKLANAIPINHKDQKAAQDFANAVGVRLQRLRSDKAENGPPPPAPTSVAHELTRLTALRDHGDLSEEQFETLRDKLLND
jgi:hypothetical protein